MRALVSSLFGLLLLLLVGVVTAQTPTVTISPDTVPIGTAFNVTANGLTPNTTYTFVIVNTSTDESVFETESTANASGRIALNLTTDAKTDQPGTYRIELRSDKATVVSQDFELQNSDTPTPVPPAQGDSNLYVFPSEGPVGTAFEILVSKLSPDQAITVSIVGPDGSEVYTIDRTAKDDGTVDINIFTERTDAPGTYTVKVTGGASASETTFVLTEIGGQNGTVTVTPQTLDTGLSYNVAIENVKPFANLTVRVKSATSATNLFESRVRASVDGKAVVVFSPEVGTEAGDYDVIVLDRDVEVARTTLSLDDAALALLSGAVLRISPADGEAGALRLITVSGLNAGETVTIEISKGDTVVSTQEKAADVNGTIALGLRDIGDNSAGEYSVHVIRGGQVVAASSLTVTAATVETPSSNVSVTIDPTSGDLGSAHTVQIAGLAAGDAVTVNVQFDGRTVYATDKVADDNGVVTLRLTTDQNDSAGTYTVEVLKDGEALATADFEATEAVAQPEATLEPDTPSTATITIDPASGPQGTQHIIRVEGLRPNASAVIQLILNDQVVFSSEKTASADGVVEFAIQTEESDTPGDYTVSVLEGDIVAASTTLTIDSSTAQTDTTPTPEATASPEATETPAPSGEVAIAIDPAFGPRGTTHTITVTGLEPDEVVQYDVRFNDASILTGQATADVTGTAVVELTSEESDAAGAYTINVLRGADVVVTGTLTVEADSMEVIPTETPEGDVTVAIDPQSGAIGTDHTVTVTGLAPNQDAVIEVEFDGESVYSVDKTADDSGTVTLTLATSEDDKTGTYTVNVVVDGDVAASADLDVTASTENTGPEGTDTPDSTDNTGPEGTDESVDTPSSQGDVLLDVSDTLEDTEQTYTFEAQAGDSIIATLSSEVFDPYLTLRGPDGLDIAYNDDFAGLDSQVGPVTLPETGEYTLAVSSYTTYEDLPTTGDFTLQVYTVSLDEITPDEPASVTFSADTQQHYFSFEAEVGDVIDINVTSEDDTDTLLTLTDSTGSVITSDDDSGEGYNPEIYQYSLSTSGTYTLLITTADTTGSAEITLHREKAASLDDGAQEVKITPKLYSRALTYEAQAGQTILMNVSVVSGEPVDLTISAYQGDTTLMSYSTTSEIPEGTVLGFQVPEDGQIQIFVYGSNPGAVSVELSIDQ